MACAHNVLIFGLFALTFSTSGVAHIVSADVQRANPDAVTINWNDDNPIDIYSSLHPGSPLNAANVVVRSSQAGSYLVDHVGMVPHYFILVDKLDHHRIEVAERLIPLGQGSNFRDIGGYAAANGKHVRWGLIYRSGAQPMLTPADVDLVRDLGITQLVDLRSDEERLVAPTKINGVPYAAVGYGLMDLMKGAGSSQGHNGADIYRNFPTLLAPQLKIVFAHLLHEKTPIVYNCSAGQDRTGFVTAMILTALGVSYDTIISDYHLSTRYRRPEFEMPPFDPALATTNPGLKMFAAYRSRPDWNVPHPLMDKNGQPFLRGAFEAIKDKWGSVDAYLDKEVGMGPARIAQLRRDYLE